MHRRRVLVITLALLAANPTFAFENENLLFAAPKRCKPHGHAKTARGLLIPGDCRGFAPA